MLTDTGQPRMTGHVLIRDYDSGEVLLDQHNAINYETLSYAIALALADMDTGQVMQMVFGNGASAVSATGEITYLTPNVTGLGATLYNQTYDKFINDNSPRDTDTQNNFIRVNHVANTTYADIVVTCLLDFNEPTGQQAFDNAVSNSGDFIFDELGLTTYKATNNSRMLLTHVIFHPVQKALNRRFQVIYTLRIVMA